MTVSVDLAALDDDALQQLLFDVEAERGRRATLAGAAEAAEAVEAQAASRLDEIAATWHGATGHGTGTPAKPATWKRPSGAHNAWPLGAFVLDEDGTVWESLIPANAETPGSGGGRWWRKVTAEADPEQGPTPWTLGTYYRPGDRVTHAGSVYVCTHEHAAQLPPDDARMWAVWSKESP